MVKTGTTGGMNVPVKDLKAFTKETGLTLSDVKELGLDTAKTLLTNYLNRFMDIREKDAAIRHLQEELQAEKSKRKSLETQQSRKTGWGTSNGWGKNDTWNYTDTKEEKSW